MAYRLGKQTAVLEFEGGLLEGAEVRCSINTPLGVMLEIEANMGDTETVEQGFRTFGDAILMSWSIEDEDGTPVPADSDGIMALPFTYALEVVKAWLGAVQQLPNLKASASKNGAMSAEALTETVTA
jgi:hypothetical protein